MSTAELDKLVVSIRNAAACAEDRSASIRSVLQESQGRRDSIADEIAKIDEDELLLHEDDTCSIWSCRYSADIVLAPHEHRMSVHVAVYRGTEVEVLYKREPGLLRHGGNKMVSAGDVITLGKEAIHAITSDGRMQSHAIHVYEGPLTKVERSLFDWKTGDEVAFTIENFRSMARRKADMTEFI